MVKSTLESKKSGMLSSHDLPESLQTYDVISPVATEHSCSLVMLKKGSEKKLLVRVTAGQELPASFEGEKMDQDGKTFVLCDLSPVNAKALRSLLPFTNPVTIGPRDSFGFGDRLGNAGAAHLRSLESSPFIPILAQQSIRELDRTKRTAQEVMDAASWAVFQEGYKSGFGADADHLKTFADIDRMAQVGYTMFTIDPSDYVDNRVVEMDESALWKAYEELPWDKLDDDPDSFRSRYIGKTFDLKTNVTLKPSGPAILQAAVKYGRVILHTREMFQYLKDTYPDLDSEVELSVDETPHPTTPEEHLVIASELKRLKVELVSLAPRFCGDFEKGVDFKGDIEQFKREYLLHQAIAGAYGGYKLSIHSGSDKFRVYEAVGSLGAGTVHVKTAGTSYLEALRAVALADPGLFREIMVFSLTRFDNDRKTYHISADPARLSEPESYSDEELPGLLDDDHARQVFHVTFGSVLTEEDASGHRRFRDRMMAVLSKNESVYEDCLYRHFRKHISPFEK